MKAKVSISVSLLLAAAAVIANSQTTPNKTRATSDVKIRQRMGPGVETVLYIKGPRMRSEMGGNAGMTTILQCDLKRTLTIYEKTKAYLITPTNGTAVGTSVSEGDGGGVNSAAPVATAPRRGGVVNITQTITDTGERKEMFGFVARRIKTSMVKTATPDACDKDQKVETDGWYIDFKYQLDCPDQPQKIQPLPVRPQPPGCQDEIRTKTSGTGKLGFPLLVTTTVYQPDGTTVTSTQEVLELSTQPLSASLFEEPQGYTLASNTQELYGMSAGSNAGTSSPSSGSKAGADATVNSTGVSSSPANTGAAGPKKPGVIRIGLVTPKVQMNSGNATQAADALRKEFASNLQGPTLEVVLLTARSGTAAATEEARQSECEYVLHASMSVKKGGGRSMFGRAIGNIAGSAAGHIPGGAPAVTAASQPAVISLKAKDELTLDYKLEPIDPGRKGLANTAKAKASRDGEDVVTGLVKRAAAEVRAQASQKQ